jgi:hypothetical protein
MGISTPVMVCESRQRKESINMTILRFGLLNHSRPNMAKQFGGQPPVWRGWRMKSASTSNTMASHTGTMRGMADTS